MAWLLAHMWAALIGVALFGLLLGWAIRGMLLVGKMRRAMVERDVTQTELEQAKEEIESLYAAQRGQPVGSSNSREAQAEQTVRIQRLTEDLARTKSELDALKAKADEAAMSAAPVAAAAAGTLAAVGGATDPNPALVWRNRHLESRVRHLEGLLSGETPAGANAGASASAEATSSDTDGPDMAAAPEATGDDVTMAKSDWQHAFLTQRVEALEAELAKVKPQSAAPAARAGNGDGEEELARLRWRNRFLEGRLAYFEGDSDVAEDAGEETEDSPVIEAPIPDVSAEVQADIAETPETPGEIAEPADAEGSPSDEADDTSESEAPVSGFEIVDRFADPLPDTGADEDAPSDMAVEDEPEAGDETDGEEIVEAGEDDADDAEIEAEAAEDDSEAPVATADEASRAILAALELTDDDEDETAAEDEPEAVASDDAVDDADDPDEDVAAEDELADEAEDLPAGVQPMALDKPVANTPDDLTVIGGIGPKIQEVLNSMGIWHYDQIAAWSPENVTYVDQELHFNGRIAREGWVQQAAVLVEDAAEEDA